MKYSGMPMGMWMLFNRSFKDNLVTVLGYSKEEADKISRLAASKYKQIIARLPEFEKKDRFKMNIVNCAMLCAFLLNMENKPDVQKLSEYYEKAMMIPAMKWFCQMSGKSKFTNKDIKAMKETAELKAADRNPYSWNMELLPYEDGTKYDFFVCFVDGEKPCWKLVQDNNKVVGIMKLRQSEKKGYENYGEIQMLYLYTSCKGKGYGKALVNKGFEVLKRK